MKIKFILFFALLVGNAIYAQEARVGINTSDPKTTLDVRGKTDISGVSLTTDVTGLQAPRLTRLELTNKGDTLYGIDQKGAIVYITDITGGNNTSGSPRENINAEGYYYFDGTKWQKIGGGGSTYSGSTSVPLNGTSFERAALIGDVTASQNSNATTVVKIQGTPVSSTPPTNGQLLRYNSTTTQWEPYSSAPTIRTITTAGDTTLLTSDIDNVVIFTAAALNANYHVTLPAVTSADAGRKLTVISTGGLSTSWDFTSTNPNYLTPTNSAISQSGNQFITDGTYWYTLSGQY